MTKNIKLKIGMCFLAIGTDYKRITRESRKNKILYCEKHGYDFIDDESIYDDSRPIPWSKIPLLLKYLDKYDYLIWVDADILIMTPEIPIEYFIEKYKDYDFVIGTDWIYENTGIMLIKNCDFSYKFLNAIWPNEYNPEEFTNARYGNYEQGSIINLIDKNYAEAKKHLKVTENQDIWNSYWYSWNWGNFAIHFAACRGELLGWLIRDYFPNKLDEDTEDSYNKRMHWLQFDCRREIDNKLKYEKEMDRRVNESESIIFPLTTESEFKKIYDNIHFNELLNITNSFDITNVDLNVVFNKEDIFDLNKQLNIYSFSKDVKKICQIGFHTGHTTLIYLISNQHSDIYIFDNCEEPYTKPCLEYLQKHFPNRIHFYEYDDIDKLDAFVKNNKDISFDLIHIDKTKRLDYTNGCYFTMLPSGHYKSILIINNQYADYLWKGFIESQKIKNIDKHPTINQHFIGYFFLD